MIERAKGSAVRLPTVIKDICRRMLDGLLNNEEVEPPQRQLRVFLVRTGEYDPLSLSDDRQLVPAGEQQAHEAGRRIRWLLDGDEVTVLISSSRPDCYQETARIIALELQVTTRASEISSPPRRANLSFLEELHSAVVIVTSGTLLYNELVVVPGSGPGLEPGFMSPPFGSVHELVITYIPETPTSSAREISRRFV